MNLNSEQSLILKLFRPLDAAAYLRTNGWRRVELKRDRLSIWTKSGESGEEYEVLLPMATQYKDFPRRVLELLDTLIAEESRAVGEIVEDITTPNADINRLRLPFEDDFIGTVPLAKSHEVFHQIKDLLLAAASAAVRPARVFGSRRPAKARGYLDEARIGRTKGGSFIVTVLSPIPPQVRLPSEQLTIFPNDEVPFPRKVMLTLAEALKTTNSGLIKLVTDGTDEDFESGMEKGISANFCDALAGLQETCSEGKLEFNFSWAPRSPIPPDPIRKADIPPHSSGYLKSIAEKLKSTASIEDVEIIGIPKKVSNTGEEQDTFMIYGVADGERKNVSITLTGSARHEAISAYEKRGEVRCRGDLVREGKYYTLKNPRNFRAISTPDSDAGK